jgi:hypothetical protein
MKAQSVTHQITNIVKLIALKMVGNIENLSSVFRLIAFAHPTK